VPERGLQDVVQCGFDPGVRDIVFADEAEDRGVERRDVPLPIGKSAIAILGLLIRDFGKRPCRRVVDDILHQVVEVAAHAGMHARKQGPDQLD
jgi:hypothetical protein